MPRIITSQHEKKIAMMIRNWLPEDRLDWSSVCIGAQEILGWNTPPTRQALDKKIAIKIAYKSKKTQIKAKAIKLQETPKPRSLSDARNRISRLQDEVLALKAELTNMAEVANRMIYNASLAGLSRDRMMAPLPTVRDPKSK